MLYGVIISVLAMAAASGASNYLVQFVINDWLTWGAFTYPLTFFVTEVTNFFYGPQIARKVVYVGVIVAIGLSIVFTDFRIAVASSVAFFISQLLDIQIFSQLRQKTWWMAPIVASVAASAIDTLIFFTLAFAGQGLPWATLALGDFLIKLSIDLVLLLPFRIFFSYRSKGLSLGSGLQETSF